MAEISIITYTITGSDNGTQAAVVFGDGQTKTISDTHSNFKLIKGLLEDKPEGYAAKVHELVNVVNTLNKRFQSLSPRVTTDGSDLFFDGDAIDGSLSKYILKLHREDAERTVSFLNGGVDNSDQGQVTWEALVKFLELLYSNPNPQSRESLYGFITRHGLTIRKDGHFIAYKGLNSEFGSINRGYGIVDGVEHNGSLPNKPGSTLRFPRKDVESNTAVGCARGLHAGTHRYASNWAQGKLVAVAINPMNVVSVPDDSSYQKIRVCEYEILNEVDPLEKAVATGGWSSSSLWTDDYKSTDSALKGLAPGDVLSFDYVSVRGESQHVEDAQVDWTSSDDFTAYVPSKDGYRTFKFNGVSNAVVNGEDSTEEESATPEASESADRETQDEPSTTEEPAAESGEQFFDRIADLFLNGGGFKPEDLLKDAGKLIPEGILPENFDLKEVKDLGEKVKRIANGDEKLGLGDVFDLLGGKSGGGLLGGLLGDSKGGFEDIFSDILGGGNKPKTETPKADEPQAEPEPAAPKPAPAPRANIFADLKVGDVASFDYVGRFGDSQHVVDAEIIEIDAVRLQTYVPSKNGHRTFLKDSISGLTISSPKVVGIAIADLKIGDTVTVELIAKDGVQKHVGAKVVLTDTHAATVRLQSGGYRSFEASDVKSISRG